ncbi:hypothetical protein E2C01_075455 [Portunus trituberculatus]|uniref:Secreted protein n=1 Tax=Portunus trituberculatus TaxID=210409 RepID=A0A5B7IAR4_PORTR|nr:hypothetical protein [Portunus trituberculatus]
MRLALSFPLALTPLGLDGADESSSLAATNLLWSVVVVLSHVHRHTSLGLSLSLPHSATTTTLSHHHHCLPPSRLDTLPFLHRGLLYNLNAFISLLRPPFTF